MTAAGAMPLVQSTWDAAERLIGVEMQPVVGADVVNAVDFRRHLEMLAWDCPIHTDSDAANAAGYRDVVSPRGLTRTWSLPAYWTPASGARDMATMVPASLVLMPGEGTALVGTENTLDFHAEIYPGDRITTKSVLRSLTRKRTRVGEGAFLVLETTYRTDAGDVVATEQSTSFRYTPATEPDRETAGSDEVSDGGEPAEIARGFPVVEIDLTLQRLIMAAGVIRDFTSSHIDSSAAQAIGAPAAFADASLVESLIERAVREWVGQHARIKRMTTRLGGFASAGQTISITGSIARVIDPRTYELEVNLQGASGRLSTAVVTVSAEPDESVHEI